ncbi:hypothetical protein JQ633_33440 [Bradyrhizobium tropiciagri]|uniref:hypothetical protein n=1 Tax=Bradyrhizobium tropiciagri TaxID=312253 RepID=UPI001BA82310|nr:hypothetical protein [Bradyrhizobium tropiciagri]MBR0875304.1 hypothetical protein [Bradyrhizobium tropiciagri]
MSDVRDFLVRSSEKIIGHYQFLLGTANSSEERERFRSRIEQEKRLLDSLRSQEKQAA